jgi:competence protein ComEC
VAAVRLDRVVEALEAQRASFPLWTPVLFGVGIALYFGLPAEPGAAALAALCLGLAAGAAGWRRGGPLARLALALVLVPGLGLGAAALRARAVAAPVLPYEMTAAVEGRVVGLGRSASDRTRVTLDRVVIHGLAAADTPATVRISLDGSTPADALVPGARLIGQARLSPPGGPSAPGGFDFRRLAWFDRLGAVGYAQSPMLEVEGGDAAGAMLSAFRVRMALSAHIRARIQGQSGAFSAAILTGDRSGIDPFVEHDLRVSTLYHLVSISGLHMSMIAAAVFVMVRYGLALAPGAALRWPLKKIAAAVAIAGTFAYLFIAAWTEVAAQRAFIMTACFLVAVLLDRPALTLRSVALSAMIVLAFAPESVVEAGFQMSFAATIALVAAFDGLRGRAWWRSTQTDRRWRFVGPALGVAMTSLVAGFATAPFSAFHFNIFAQYGLVANLLAVPIMGAVVMPAAVAAALAAPFGLDAIPFTVMGWGVAYVLAVADFVAGLGGAATGVPSGPPASLGLLAIGALFVVLWSGPARWAGLAPMALAAGLWAVGERPPLLVSADGRLFGFLTPEGRALSSATSDAYAAAAWLEDDGDTASQAAAHARAPFVVRRGFAEAEAPGFGRIRYVGFRDPARGARDCAEAAIVIAPQWREPPPGRCLFIGAATLRRDGALALRPGPHGPRIEAALAAAARRPWGAVAAPRPRRARSGTTTGAAAVAEAVTPAWRAPRP